MYEKIKQPINDFFNAWKMKDYKGMVEASQKSWQEFIKDDPVKRLESWFENKQLTQFTIGNITDETNKVNRFLKQKKSTKKFEGIYTVKVKISYVFRQGIYTSNIMAKVIMENGILKINPTSIIKEIRVV